MRFACVPFAVLTASLTLAGSPSATIDPSANYFKIDMTRPPPPPTPVYVVNFPDTQAVIGTVSVDNFPAVQAVAGTVAVSNLPAVQAVGGIVNVGNLPAVQTVGGTVNVGNLPLDADGAMRVTSAAASRQMVWYELLDAPVDLCAGQFLQAQRTVNTDGYSLVSARIVVSNNTAVSFEPVWQLADDEEFLPLADIRDNLTICQGNSSTRLVCRNAGGNVKVQITSASGCPHVISSVRVYLFP